MNLEYFDIHEAMRYLNESENLRSALHIERDAKLVPHPLGQGEHNENYWFAHPATGQKLVLRVNVATQPFHDDQVGYEFAALCELEASNRTPKPYFIDNSPSAPAKGVLVTEFCEGQQLDFDELRPGDLRCAAQIMADVHAVQVREDSKIHRPRNPLTSLYEECLERIKTYHASGFEEERLTAWVERFASACEKALQAKCFSDDCAHIINTETLPSHFLIPEDSANDVANAQENCMIENPGFFIDWERPIIGEVAQDVAYFVSPTTTFWDSEFLFPVSDVDAFVELYWKAVDGRFPRGNFDERFKSYRMLTVFRSVSWCCRALASYRGEMGHTTEKTAQKLPVYLSDEFMEMLAVTCFEL